MVGGPLKPVQLTRLHARSTSASPGRPEVGSRTSAGSGCCQRPFHARVLV